MRVYYVHLERLFGAHQIDTHGTRVVAQLLPCLVMYESRWKERAYRLVRVIMVIPPARVNHIQCIGYQEDGPTTS